MTGQCRMQNDECRMGTPGGRRRLLSVLCILHSSFCILFLAGCAKPAEPTTRPLTMRERQDQTIRDPMGYSPDMDRTDISGGGLSEFDNEGFGKDLKNVFNP